MSRKEKILILKFNLFLERLTELRHLCKKGDIVLIDKFAHKLIQSHGDIQKEAEQIIKDYESDNDALCDEITRLKV